MKKDEILQAYADLLKLRADAQLLENKINALVALEKNDESACVYVTTNVERLLGREMLKLLSGINA